MLIFIYLLQEVIVPAVETLKFGFKAWTPHPSYRNVSIFVGKVVKTPGDQLFHFDGFIETLGLHRMIDSRVTCEIKLNLWHKCQFVM